jgi:hypothetical protein
MRGERIGVLHPDNKYNLFNLASLLIAKAEYVEASQLWQLILRINDGWNRIKYSESSIAAKSLEHILAHLLNKTPEEAMQALHESAKSYFHAFAMFDYELVAENQRDDIVVAINDMRYVLNYSLVLGVDAEVIQLSRKLFEQLINKLPHTGEAMKIEFSGKLAIDSETFGVSFQATVDGVDIRCRVDNSTLQDIDPPNRMNDALSQFQANQSAFQTLAEKLIRSGRVKDGQLIITVDDIHS